MTIKNRYVVLKNTDIKKHLRPYEHNNLKSMLAHINEGRISDGRATLKCIIVEQDWPIYEEVLSLLEGMIPASDKTRYIKADNLQKVMNEKSIHQYQNEVVIDRADLEKLIDNAEEL